MTWFIFSLILVAAVKILVSCPPTFVVNWLMTKFELHPELSGDTTTVTIDGKSLEGEDKIQVINQFNESIFLERYYMPPKGNGTPLIIDTKRGKNDVRFFLYSYDDRVDVVKQYKKKVVGYSILSDSLQKQSILIAGDII